MKRMAFCVLWLLLALGSPSNATSTWCGVFDNSKDQLLHLRTAPSANYSIIGDVTKEDLLYVGTERCRNDLGIGSAEFGPEICAKDKNWVFVEEVKSEDRHSATLKGWANSRFIRQIACPD
jgi:hypothetical protein